MTKSGNVVPLTEEDKKNCEKAIKDLAKKGLRTLAICVK